MSGRRRGRPRAARGDGDGDGGGQGRGRKGEAGSPYRLVRLRLRPTHPLQHPTASGDGNKLHAATISFVRLGRRCGRWRMHRHLKQQQEQQEQQQLLEQLSWIVRWRMRGADSWSKLQSALWTRLAPPVLAKFGLQIVRVHRRRGGRGQLWFETDANGCGREGGEGEERAEALVALVLRGITDTSLRMRPGFYN